LLLLSTPIYPKQNLWKFGQGLPRHEKKTIGKSHVKKINQPKDIDLLLGIHFLRLFGITYKNIHQAYINKEVPHYNGNYHFLTEFDLQKYYKRNIGKIKDI
jgi:hypothetical protein